MQVSMYDTSIKRNNTAFLQEILTLIIVFPFPQIHHSLIRNEIA